MAPHSSTLAWKIPWTKDLVGYSPWGRKELDTTERLQFQYKYPERKQTNLGSSQALTTIAVGQMLGNGI